MNASELSDRIQGSRAARFAVRAFTADFQRHRAEADERQQLAVATPPITNALAQDYLAWRRAALWVAAVLLLLGIGIALSDHRPVAEQVAVSNIEQAGLQLDEAAIANEAANFTHKFGAGNLQIIDGLQDFLLFVKLIAAVLVLLAARRWVRVASSRTLARWALIVSLVLPLIVSAWPWSQSLDFSHLDQGGAQTQAAKQSVSVLIAVALVSTLAPKLMALFPGIMRSSLGLKTLLPEATAPGWLTVVFAPFLIGFLLLSLCLLSQLQGSWLLIGAVVLLIAGPCVYLRNASNLVRSHTVEEVGGVVRAIRRTALMFNGVGMLLLVVYLFDLDDLSWLSALHLLLEGLGGILVTMVAISDVTLALLAFGQKQGAVFHESAMRAAYEGRLSELSGSGLTDVEGALGVRNSDRNQVGAA